MIDGGAYTEKMTLLPQQNLLSLRQETRIVVVTISLFTATILGVVDRIRIVATMESSPQQFCFAVVLTKILLRQQTHILRQV